MGNLLKVMHWQIENTQALHAWVIALVVFSAIAESNLNNKRAGKSTRLSYFDLDLIEYLDYVRIWIYDLFLKVREGESDH